MLAREGGGIAGRGRPAETATVRSCDESWNETRGHPMETNRYELTTAMESLVRDVREAVEASPGPERTSRAVADVLSGRVGEGRLLTEAQKEGAPDDYAQHVLHVEDDGSFSVVSLVWLPGQETPIHDHVTWCVPAVHQGREAEVHYDGVSDGEGAVADRGREGRRVDYLVEKARSEYRPGDVTALTPPGDIHRVRNPGPEKAISIHVYGADIGELGSSIRRCYSQPVKGTGDARSDDGAPPGAEPARCGR